MNSPSNRRRVELFPERGKPTKFKRPTNKSTQACFFMASSQAFSISFSVTTKITNYSINNILYIMYSLVPIVIL